MTTYYYRDPEEALKRVIESMAIQLDEHGLHHLKISYKIYFIGNNDIRLRNQANACKGKYHTVEGILEACYPFQSKDGHLMKRYRDRKTGHLIWKPLAVKSGVTADQVMQRCFDNFVKNQGEPVVEYHSDGELISE